MSLSASELASMRATLTASLPDTCEILDYTSTIDNEGGQADTWETAGQGVTVACRVASSGFTNEERVILDRIAAQRGYVVTLPAGTVVNERDRILWSGRGLEVKSVTSRSWPVSVRVIAEQIA